MSRALFLLVFVLAFHQISMAKEQKSQRPIPLAALDGKMFKYVQAAFLVWSKDVPGANTSLVNYKITVYREPAGVRVCFTAKRQADELGLKGGRCRNGRDVQYKVDDDFVVIGHSFFK